MFILCRERIWANVNVAVCGVFLFFLLVTGCVLKIGRDSLCDSVLHTVPNMTRWNRHTQCSRRPGACADIATEKPHK